MKKLIPLLLLSALLRLAWWFYTHYTAEDAYITFGFARRLAEGQGFAYNIGEPIYGTTTPLFTLLMTLWMFISSDPALGATLFGLLASLGGLVFLYLSLNRWETQFALWPIVLALPIIMEDMAGMETSLLFLFVAGAWWAYQSKRPLLAGVMCGLLLWTRMDSIVFVIVMFFLYANKPNVLWFILGTLVYLPWLIFAHVYFGSEIPFTLTAKMVAYGTGVDRLPMQFGRLLDYFPLPLFLSTMASFAVLPRKYIPLAIFFVLETAFLCYSGSTFFSRYFYLLFVTSSLLIGVALSIQTKRWKVIGLLAFLLMTFRWETVEHYKYVQEERHANLQKIGMWLNENTPVDATLQLEPLGYMGYYADRFVYDEVGLVTPVVVELHRRQIGADNFYKYLKTDYVILQCGQARNVMEDFDRDYDLIQTFTEGHPRACYEVWERTDG